MTNEEFKHWLANPLARSSLGDVEQDLYECQPTLAEALIGNGEVTQLLNLAEILDKLSENELKSCMHNAMMSGKAASLLAGHRKLGTKPDRVTMSKALEEATLRGRISDLDMLSLAGLPIDLTYKHVCLVNKCMLGKNPNARFVDNFSIRKRRPDLDVFDLFPPLDIEHEVIRIDPKDLHLFLLGYQVLEVIVSETSQNMWESPREKAVARSVVTETKLRQRHK